MTRRIKSPNSKWHGQVFTFTPATNDPSYLVSAPPSSLVFHESELEGVAEQQGTPRSVIAMLVEIVLNEAGKIDFDWTTASYARIETALKEEGYELKLISKP
jgi:hypothetical protein